MLSLLVAMFYVLPGNIVVSVFVAIVAKLFVQNLVLSLLESL